MNAHGRRTTRRATSYYVTDAFYSELIADFADWQRDDRAIADPAERDRFRALLEREARLLDQLDFDDWLAMYRARMHLLGAGDARTPATRAREIAIIVRRPPPPGGPHLSAAHRLCLVAGAEVAHGADGHQCRGVRRRRSADTRMVRSNFLISEFRADDTRFLSGWCGHRFVEQRRPLADRRCGRST